MSTALSAVHQVSNCWAWSKDKRCCLNEWTYIITQTNHSYERTYLPKKRPHLSFLPSDYTYLFSPLCLFCFILLAFYQVWDLQELRVLHCGKAWGNPKSVLCLCFIPIFVTPIYLNRNLTLIHLLLAKTLSCNCPHFFNQNLLLLTQEVIFCQN